MKGHFLSFAGSSFPAEFGQTAEPIQDSLSSKNNAANNVIRQHSEIWDRIWTDMSSTMLSNHYRRRNLGQFFTNPAVGDILVGMMATDDPKSIVDLGAGYGHLSKAARRRWKNASIVTVDLDPQLKFTLDADSKRHNHIQVDALSSELPKEIGSNFGNFDIAICNPPYIAPVWRSEYKGILEEVGLYGALLGTRDARADVLFLAQNLRLTRGGGLVGLIVPDGFITGERLSGLRRKLIDGHSIRCVIGLPRTAFCGTEAKTHIIVFQKSTPKTSTIQLMRLSNTAQLSAPLMIPSTDGYERLDFEYHSSRLACMKNY